MVHALATFNSTQMLPSLASGESAKLDRKALDSPEIT